MRLGRQQHHYQHHLFSAEGTETCSCASCPQLPVCFCLLCIYSPLPSFLFRMPLHTQSTWFSQGQPLPQDPMEAKSGLANQTMCVCSVARSCPTFGKHMDCSLSGSSAHRILQARILGWGLPFPQTSSCLWHTTQVIPIRIPKLWDFGQDTFFFILGMLRRETWSCWQPCCHQCGQSWAKNGANTEESRVKCWRKRGTEIWSCCLKTWIWLSLLLLLLSRFSRVRLCATP